MAAITMMLTSVHCAAPTPTPGPPPPIESRVTSIRVTKLIAATRRPWQVTDRSVVSEVTRSPAFTAGIWHSASRRELIPQYQVEFFHDNTAESIYFLGTNSYPPKFPCYSFCSGWWLGAARPDGSFDPSRYSAIPDTRYIPLLDALDLP